MCLDLRKFALRADQQKTKGGKNNTGQTLEKASEGIMACFRVCAADARSAEELSKKWDIFYELTKK